MSDIGKLRQVFKIVDPLTVVPGDSYQACLEWVFRGVRAQAKGVLTHGSCQRDPGILRWLRDDPRVTWYDGGDDEYHKGCEWKGHGDF